MQTKLLTLLLVLCDSAAHAITFELSGHITAFGTGGLNPPPDFGIQAGDRWSGFLTYELGLPALLSLPDMALYGGRQTGSFLSLTVRGQTFAAVAPGSGSGHNFEIGVWNRVADEIIVGFPGFTVLGGIGEVNTPDGPYAPSSLFFHLTDTTGTALSSAALPEDYDLAAWNGHTIELFASSDALPSKLYHLVANIEHIERVPESMHAGLTLCTVLVSLFLCQWLGRRVRLRGS